MSLLWLLALGAVRADIFEDVVMRLEITGDTELWDALFKGARQLETVVGDDKVTWSEGPLWTNGSLLFTDTITAKLHRYDPATRTLSTLAECAGGVCADAPGEEWRAEPGANGLALWSPAGGGAPTVLACQHGTARGVALDTDAVAGGRPRALSAGAHAVPIATHGARGRRLNGPNDLAVAGEWAYFTDPVYAFLELERFEDLPYLDEAVRERGAGVTGIYRARLRAPGASSPPPAAELLDASLSRPNGIAVLPPDRGAGASARERLVVSECCQGEHNAACAQGVGRWRVYELAGGDGPDDGAGAAATQLRGLANIELEVADAPPGCADGLAAWPTGRVGGVHGPLGEEHELLLASCPGGLCVVSVTAGRVLARARGARTSNVAFGSDGYVYITGLARVWRLPYDSHAKLPRASSTRPTPEL